MRIQRYMSEIYFRSIEAVELAETGLDGVNTTANHLTVKIPITVDISNLILRA